MAAAKYEILKRIFVALGPAAKRHYGMAMKLAEDDLANMENKHMDITMRRELTMHPETVAGNPDANVAWGW